MAFGKTPRLISYLILSVILLGMMRVLQHQRLEAVSATPPPAVTRENNVPAKNASGTGRAGPTQPGREAAKVKEINAVFAPVPSPGNAVAMPAAPAPSPVPLSRAACLDSRNFSCVHEMALLGHDEVSTDVKTECMVPGGTAAKVCVQVQSLRMPRPEGTQTEERPAYSCLSSGIAGETFEGEANELAPALENSMHKCTKAAGVLEATGGKI